MDVKAEVYKQFQTGQDKLVYFLLAIAASGVALAVQQTKGASISPVDLLLFAAVIMWGFSFYAGYKNRSWALSTLYTNAGMLAAQDGTHPITQKYGNAPEAIALVTEESRKIMDQQSNSAGTWAKAQFNLLIVGIVLYVGWHVSGMALRTDWAARPWQ